MAKARSIKIVELEDGTVVFKPDISSAQPGQPLGANAGDIVTWNNRTNQAHWPVAIDPPGFLTNDIPAGEVSNPIFNIQGPVKYRCQHHPQEQGSIVVPASATKQGARPGVRRVGSKRGRESSKRGRKSEGK